MKTAPIIPWLGGKRRLAGTLLALFPEHQCYVEVFAGGAALYFMRPQPAPVEVINDINGDVVNLYRVVQHHLEEFVRQFKWALVSREMFKWLKDTPPETLTDIQRAARFFYLQHTCFGGRVESRSFGTATTSPAINLLRIEERLSAAHLRLAGTTIERLDWAECIRRYDRPHTLFYCDPPYYETEGYGVEFDLPQYERLAGALRTMRGRAIVSLGDHPAMRAAFAGLQIATVPITYTVGGGGKPARRNELIVSNFTRGGKRKGT